MHLHFMQLATAAQNIPFNDTLRAHLPSRERHSSRYFAKYQPFSPPVKSFVPQLSHEIFHKKLIFCRCASANRAAEPSFFLLSDSIASRSCALSCHVFSSPWCAKLLPYGPLPRGRYRPAILFIAFSKTDAPEAPALSQQKMRPNIERMVNASFFDFAT